MAPRRRRSPSDQLGLFEARVRTAPCVPAIRAAVAEWVRGDYRGVSDTTRQLLNYWFHTDHRLPNGRRFSYYDCQREATETLIYLYEVVGVRRYRDLMEQYAPNLANLRLLQYDDFCRYCIKMATGSGKTKVMSLVMAWQYYNAVLEGRDDYCRTALLIAPNVIVFERLRTDFAGGRIFRTDPVIPPELSIYWDMECYLRGEGERASSQGALYLTNIQQFYERPDRAARKEPEPMLGVMGSRPTGEKLEIEDFDKRIAARGGPCLVINDEGHHTHDEESEWNRFIRRLHDQVGGGLAAQFDFTATPRHTKGGLFTWTIYDYPLKQAIIDGIVKRPMKGITRGMPEGRSAIASVRYRTHLTAGVERWREYATQLAPLNQKPILFVMMNRTKDADDVGDYLRRKYPADFAAKKLLIIHTDRKGEVSKRDLDKARKLAREVDDQTSPVNAIVSVLMLREGWDVQNVTVVVGLRPYTAKANILPEQTIGRGLRLMFRGWAVRPTYTERVDIIGNAAFLKFVEQLERDEEIEFGEFDLEKDKLVIVTIAPDPAKMDKDIAVPVLSPILARKKSLADEIEALDVASLHCPVLPMKEDDRAAEVFRYEGYDIITLEKLIEREYVIPEVQTAQEVISFYAKRIAQEVKLPSQFAVLAPKVREFLEHKAFGETVNLDSPEMIKAISTNVAQYVTVKTFARALREAVVQELEPQLLHTGRPLSATPPFPYSRPTLEATKTVFNLVPCDNQFEKEFAHFCENSEDVAAFSKLPQQFGFQIEYTDAASNLRYYEPDFVVVLSDGTHFLIETKGREDINVRYKDRAALLWCENATALTDTTWEYLKVPQSEYNSLHPTAFTDLVALSRAMF